MSMRRTPILVMALLATLAACGGGQGDATGSSGPSKQTIQSVSANGAVMPNDSTEALAVALSTARAAVAVSTTAVAMPIHIACLGGGSAAFTVSGPDPAKWFNGVLDVGEHYAISFDRCQTDFAAPPVSGTLTLVVNDPGSATLSVSTTTTNLSVTLPLRTVTLNGSSTLTQTVSVSASSGNTTTTHRWQSPDVQVTSRRNGFDSLFRLTNVDYSRGEIVAVNGMPVGSSCQGGSTLNADLALFTWFITLATVGPVLYDTTGVIVQGSWVIGLPDDRITLTISQQSVTVQVDLGANGSIDLSFSFLFQPFFDEAG